MSNQVMENIFQEAKRQVQRIAFPEATEEKILLACQECVVNGICIPYLVGDAPAIIAAADRYQIELEGMELIDATNEAWLQDVIERYVSAHPLNSAKTMKRKAKDPLYTALMMLAIDEVDCAFAGMSHTTGDVIMAGNFVIGLQDDVSTVSSVGIFEIPGYEGPEGNLLGFGDSAVCSDPDPEELAGIAISACRTIRDLVGWDPKCALLSFSTDGSAEHPLVDKVRTAVKIANERAPELAIDGEFQLDTALNPQVAAKKIKRASAVAGQANIIIWPDLNVGNIGVKLMQQFAHADAYGPMLQGFRKIVCDCSRSAPVSELVGNIAMSAVRASRAAQSKV